MQVACLIRCRLLSRLKTRLTMDSGSQTHMAMPTPHCHARFLWYTYASQSSHMHHTAGCCQVTIGRFDVEEHNGLNQWLRFWRVDVCQWLVSEIAGSNCHMCRYMLCFIWHDAPTFPRQQLGCVIYRCLWGASGATPQLHSIQCFHIYTLHSNPFFFITHTHHAV